MASRSEFELDFLAQVKALLPIKLGQSVYFLERTNKNKKNSRVLVRVGKIKGIHFFSVQENVNTTLEDFYITLTDDLGLVYSFHLCDIYQEKRTALYKAQLINASKILGVKEDMTIDGIDAKKRSKDIVGDPISEEGKEVMKDFKVRTLKGDLVKKINGTDIERYEEGHYVKRAKERDRLLEGGGEKK